MTAGGAGADAPLLDRERLPRLEAWIAGKAGADRVRVVDEGPLSGGAISLNLAVTLEVEGGALAGRHETVLRTGSASGVSASLGKAQEGMVLRAAFAAGARVPEPLFISDTGGADDALLGAPFYIMRRARGVAAGRKLVKSDEPQRELARELGRQLGLIHSIKPGAAGLDFLSLPEPSPALQCERDYREWIGRFAGTDPVLAYGLRWLTLHAPPTGELVLCHRDYRTGNYMVDQGQLTAIIDWEFAGWSDPMEDLGWFCAASWRFGQTDRQAGGLADRAHFYAGYEETAGRRVDQDAVAYWETAAYLRWAAIAIQQGMRHTSGTEPSLELALTGRMLPEIEQDLLGHLDSLTGRNLFGEDHMINDEPDARGLVAIALQTFQGSILPLVPAKQRFEALMIANALSIAERELAAKPDEALATAIGGLIGESGDLETLAPKLCSAIDGETFDTPERQTVLRKVLWELTRTRLSISNPRLLDRSSS